MNQLILSFLSISFALWVPPPQGPSSKPPGARYLARDGSSIAFNRYNTFSEHMRAMNRFITDASPFVHLKQVAVRYRPGYFRRIGFAPLESKTLEASDLHSEVLDTMVNDHFRGMELLGLITSVPFSALAQSQS